MINSTLDKRLLSCADYVRAGAVFADIGTDHGYLPIFLLKTGRIQRAYLSDINEGPLSSAERNVHSEGLANRCEFILTDGASALEGLGITDYAICGMGGELISRIIANAPSLHTAGIRLILQPMTKQEHLRRYLASAGFAVIDECFSFDSGKFYLTLVAEYSGECSELTLETAELGADLPHDRDRVEYLGFLEGKRKAVLKALNGKAEGGLSTDDERARLEFIDKRISKIKSESQKEIL